jgi:hypothetical protein
MFYLACLFIGHIKLSMERRQFNRILFEAKANILLAKHSWEVTLLDLSLRGALIQPPSIFEHDPMQLYSLRYHLQGSDKKIVMLGSLHPYNNNRFGFETHYMDIHSATELRTLISLNTFNVDLLERDLQGLCKPVVH